jgi:hypothetical protein
MVAFSLEKGAAAFPVESRYDYLAPDKSPSGHVVLHHGAFLQLLPNTVCMIRIGCLEMLLEVIIWLSRLTLEVTLSCGDEPLIGVNDLLLCDSLGPPLWPLLSFLVPLFSSLQVVLSGAPQPPPRAAFPLF